MTNAGRVLQDASEKLIAPYDSILPDKCTDFGNPTIAKLHRCKRTRDKKIRQTIKKERRSPCKKIITPMSYVFCQQSFPIFLEGDQSYYTHLV